MRRLLLGLVVLTAVACSAQPGPSERERPGQAERSERSEDTGTPRATVRADHRDELTVARSFTKAANRGDKKAVMAAFAPKARFDSVGRIYQGRDDIYGRFLGPEVVDAGGRFREVSARSTGDRVVVGYDYDTGHGGRESFTYAYRIERGVIVDVVGRYSGTTE